MGALENQDVGTFEEYQEEIDGIEQNQRWGRWSMYGGVGLLVGGLALVGWDLMTVGEVPVGDVRLDVGGDGVRAVWEVQFE